MMGPYPPGKFLVLPTLGENSWEYNTLERDANYRVIKPFTDFDGTVHNLGDEWTFLGAMFDRMDSTLFLCISKLDKSEWQIPLNWDPENQGEIIDSFSREYVVRASP
jgi:hypothetical protein